MWLEKNVSVQRLVEQVGTILVGAKIFREVDLTKLDYPIKLPENNIFSQ